MVHTSGAFSSRPPFSSSDVVIQTLPNVGMMRSATIHDFAEIFELAPVWRTPAANQWSADVSVTPETIVWWVPVQLLIKEWAESRVAAVSGQRNTT